MLHLYSRNATIFIDNKRHHHLTFDVLSLRHQGITQIACNPFHKGNHAPGIFRKLLNDAEMQWVVVFIHSHRRLCSSVLSPILFVDASGLSANALRHIATVWINLLCYGGGMLHRFHPFGHCMGCRWGGSSNHIVRIHRRHHLHVLAHIVGNRGVFAIRSRRGSPLQPHIKQGKCQHQPQQKPC